MSEWRVKSKYAVAIREAERAHEIPQNLLARLLYQMTEGFDDNLITGKGRNQHVGVLGIARLTPEQGRQYNVDRTDAYACIPVAAKHLRSLYLDFGNWRDALLAYSWGKETTLAHKRGMFRDKHKNAREYVARIVADVSV